MATPTIDKPKVSRKEKKAQKAAAEPVGITRGGTPQRRKQLPWAVFGILLVACSILGFAYWTLTQAERTPVLVAASDIQAGQIITRQMVTTVAVGADSGVRLLTADEGGLVIGNVARGPIPVGTPLSPLLVAETDAVPAGSAIVGASLGPGEYPTSALRAGDRVELVKVTPASTIDNERLEVLGVAKIWTVEQLVTGGEPKLFISLEVDADDSATVTNAISQDRLRLVLIGAEQ